MCCNTLIDINDVKSGPALWSTNLSIVALQARKKTLVQVSAQVAALDDSWMNCHSRETFWTKTCRKFSSEEMVCTFRLAVGGPGVIGLSVLEKCQVCVTKARVWLT
jgi:hypothetical protein